VQPLFRLLFITFIFLASCSSYKLSWTDKSPREIWREKPDDFDGCFTRLDSILSERAKNHFKNTEEEVAVIEISRELGESFIRNWQLIPGAPLYLYFKDFYLDDPQEIIRIVFTSYHRILNKKTFTIDSVIKQYKAYWIHSKQLIPPGQFVGDRWMVDSKMEAMEDSILNRFYFKKLAVNDTLSASLSYEGRQLSAKPSSYYIEAVVVKKDPVTDSLLVKLTQIACSQKCDFIWYDYTTERRIGDVMTIEAGRWDKKDEVRFRY
jgi:hypothetical protein